MNVIMSALTVTGYDAYILDNDTMAFYYQAASVIRFKALPLPGSRKSADIINFGSVRDLYFVAFSDAIFYVGICINGLCGRQPSGSYFEFEELENISSYAPL